MSSHVIKARTLELTRHAVVKREVQLARQDANEILAQAHREAQRIVSEAEQKAKSVFDSAREDGNQSAADRWYEALAEAWRARDNYLASNESSVLQLAVRIAEKLIGQELSTSPDTITGILREALRSARRAKSLVVRVNPADAKILGERIPSLHASPSAAREIEIVPDQSLSRGDCVVESDIGIIDARLETQLKNLERVLTLKMST